MCLIPIAEFSNYLYPADNVTVEFFKLFRRNPKLLITAPLAAVLLHWPPGVALICSRKPGTMPLRLFHSGNILNFMRALLIIFLKKERN